MLTHFHLCSIISLCVILILPLLGDIGSHLVQAFTSDIVSPAAFLFRVQHRYNRLFKSSPLSLLYLSCQTSLLLLALLIINLIPTTLLPQRLICPIGNSHNADILNAKDVVAKPRVSS
jgi:hypothetical protein